LFSKIGEKSDAGYICAAYFHTFVSGKFTKIEKTEMTKTVEDYILE